MERLNKRIAESGYCSRRKADEFISEGKVKINGVMVNELGTKVDDDDVITINGNLIEKITKKTYIVMNKPDKAVCTLSDPQKRTTVYDLLPDELKNIGLKTVGRLDYNTKGVLLLTNDGDFTNCLIGPKSGLKKTYQTRVTGTVGLSDLKKLKNGLTINNAKTLPAIAEIVEYDDIHESTLINITITQGSYHIVKELMKSLGHEVKKLKRIAYGCVTLEGLKNGEIRTLTSHEIKTLKALSALNKDLSKRGE